jgi:hypothetical protein
MKAGLLTLIFVMMSWHNSVFAGVLTLDFDFRGSTFMARTISGIPIFNVSDGVNGSVTGSARIELTGVDELGGALGFVVSGTLSDFSVVFGLNVQNFSVPNVDATLVGSIGIMQVGRADFFVFDQSQLIISPTLRLSQDIDCVGNSSTCAQIGSVAGVMFPFSSVLPSSSLALVLLQLGIPGSATLTGMMPPTRLSGIEVSRRFVPEPAEMQLMILGLVAVAAVWTISIMHGQRRRHGYRGTHARSELDSNTTLAER